LKKYETKQYLEDESKQNRLDSKTINNIYTRIRRATGQLAKSFFCAIHEHIIFKQLKAENLYDKLGTLLNERIICIVGGEDNLNDEIILLLKSVIKNELNFDHLFEFSYKIINVNVKLSCVNNSYNRYTELTPPRIEHKELVNLYILKLYMYYYDKEEDDFNCIPKKEYDKLKVNKNDLKDEIKYNKNTSVKYNLFPSSYIKHSETIDKSIKTPLPTPVFDGEFLNRSDEVSSFRSNNLWMTVDNTPTPPSSITQMNQNKFYNTPTNSFTNNKKSSEQKNEIWKDTLQEFGDEFLKIFVGIRSSNKTGKNKYEQILKVGKKIDYTILYNLWIEIKKKSEQADCLKQFKKDMNKLAYFSYWIEINRNTKINAVAGTGFCGYTTVIYLINQNNKVELERMGFDQKNNFWKFDWKCSEYVYKFLKEEIKFWDDKMHQMKISKTINNQTSEEIIAKLLFKLNGAKNEIETLKNNVNNAIMSTKDKKEVDVNLIREEMCSLMFLDSAFWIGDELGSLIFSVRLGFPIMSFEKINDLYNHLNGGDPKKSKNFVRLTNFNSPTHKALATFIYGNENFPYTDAVISGHTKKNGQIFTISTIKKLLELKMNAFYCGNSHNYKLNVDYKESLDFVMDSFETVCTNLFTGLYENMCKVYEKKGETESLFTSNDFKRMFNIQIGSLSPPVTEVVNAYSEDDSPQTSSSSSSRTNSLKRNVNDTDFDNNNELISKKFKYNDSDQLFEYLQKTFQLMDNKTPYDNEVELINALIKQMNERKSQLELLEKIH
jgi:hypothetical protein